MKTLMTGILLFFLFTGYDKYSFLTKHSFVADERSLELHDTLTSTMGKQDFQLSSIPNVRIRLVTGECMELQQLMDQKKYIFINIWSRKEAEDIKGVLVVDSIAEVYKNKLLVIGLLEGGNLDQLKKVVKKYQLKNMNGLVSVEIKKYVNVSVCPYGILFSKTGKLIEAGMDGSGLAAYMKKHVVTGRAKF